MTPGQRINHIMHEEREATADRVAALPLTQSQQDDVARVYMAIQRAVNQWVQAEDRTMDARIIPAALTLAADEIQRVYARLASEGLTSDPD